MKKLIGVLFFAFCIYAGSVTYASANNHVHKCTTTQSNVGGNTSHDCVDLKGYAWGADNSPFGGVGWINLNNTSTGSNTAGGNASYWVEFDRDDWALRGYAWSERYGYIRFGGFAANEFPSQAACQTNPKDSSGNAACNVHLVQSGAGYQLVGYARFCFVYQTGCSGNLRPAYELGGFDGWIAFKTSTGGVSYGTSNNAFTGFAWGGGSGSTSSANYGSGTGWIKMNPSGGGVSCYRPNGSQSNCIDDSADLPVVTLTASPNPAAHNNDVTLSWTITNIPSGCTPATSSSPANSTWNNYTVTSLASGSKNIGTISAPTTFTLSCTYNGKKGSADVLVDISAYTPIVTLSAPAQKNYGESAILDYTITNIPYGCSAQLYNNGNTLGNAITISGNGTTSYSKQDSITVNNLTATANWELKCTDSTPPSPARVGSATAKTTVVVPTPVVSISAKSRDTGSTTTFPCTNTGAEITYKAKDVKPGSCKAWFNNTQNFSGWGSSTSITEDGADHTVTTGAVTGTGNSNYNAVFYLRCEKLDGTPWAAGHFMNHSCTAGSLSVSAASSCVTPSDTVRITYSGSGFNSGSCTMSWRSAPNNKINQSSFNSQYAYPASMLTVGQSYTYTVSGCQESSYPSNAPLSASATVNVENTCTNNNPTPCTGLRCLPGRAPTFKEF